MDVGCECVEGIVVCVEGRGGVYVGKDIEKKLTFPSASCSGVE